MDADDARAHLDAGARAIQVGTALFHDPTTAFRIVHELAPPAGEDRR
jgi:dihydroorotate dehydrogenase (NAD+) catalytic subunit